MHLQMKPVEEAKRVFSNRLNLDRYLKHHRRIFQLFPRVHERDNEEGTGLGLAIVGRIVRNFTICKKI
jgi:light-regulated signal transduction histidine kinase (bacteriophytochrome)